MRKPREKQARKVRKEKYVVDSERSFIPFEPHSFGRHTTYAIIVLPSAEFPSFELALGEAAHRIKAGHNVRITRPDGGHIHHDDIISMLKMQTPGR